MFRYDPFPAGHFVTNPNDLSPKSSTMDSLLATYNDDDNSSSTTTTTTTTTTTKSADNVITGSSLPAAVTTITTTVESEIEPAIDLKDEPMASEDLSDLDPKDSPNFAKLSSTSEDDGLLDDNDNPPAKKQKQLSALPLSPPELVKPEPESPANVEATIPKGKPPASASASSKKKGKGKNNNVWTKSASRKGKKKTKGNTPNASAQKVEDTVLISPIPRFLDKNDDNVDAKICLSKVYKAEKVELSEDRMSAGSCKGYRMVRATRGVTEGAWYFEIKVVKLGETGHTRLGWSTEKGDLQAPVGYDGNSFGYRDIDGSKLHKALREKYGEEGYVEGDVIGFYINLPDGSLYEPKPPQLVFFKGQKYMCAPDAKEDPPKVVPGSEISFFRNGICQGVAFKDLFGGRYYPAASMYTLPDQPNCVVKFNFGPEFEAFPEDFGGRPLPKPMVEVPYRSFESKVENGDLWGPPRMCPRVKLVKEHDTKTMDAGE